MKKRFEIKKGVFMEDNALYGEFDWLGVHIDINKNNSMRSVEASTLHELGHQELASSTTLGMLDFLIANISKLENDEKTKRKLDQLYERIYKSTINVQESFAVFFELKYLEEIDHDEYVKLRSYYISTGTYINKYRFGELLFLFKNSNVEENKCAVDAMRTIAINAMNINLYELALLDGKYLHIIDKKLDKYNANYRFFKVIKYIENNNINLAELDENSISKIFSILQLEVFKNFEWNDFKNWVTESLLKPLNLKEIEEYVSYQMDMDCVDELLSASAYVSNRCKYEIKDANTKEEIEDAFRNSKILFVDDSYDAGKAVLYFAIDIDNKRAFRFASRYVFVNWFRYIPITFTDRNHYKSIIDKEPLFANVPALIDLADMNPNTINFIYDINVTEYYIEELNDRFSIIFLKGMNSNIFFHVSSKSNVFILEKRYLTHMQCKLDWWDDIIPLEHKQYFDVFVMEHE